MEEFPFLYVPVGSLEWHGEHMALGNDAIKMANLCRVAAQVGGGIVFPPVFFGIPGFCTFDPQYGVEGGAQFSEELLHTVLWNILERAEELEFRAAMIVTGHTCLEQMKLMKTVAQEWQAEGHKLHVIGQSDMEFGDEVEYTSDHAAHWETSLLWYVRPDLVDLSRLDNDPETKPYNVFGKDPRVHASRELGERAVHAIARDMAQWVKETMREVEQSG
jgi:creatinine amidohydrolase